ncbi:MAG: divergent PAP2 family protein [Spirochaetales bacterium]
MNPLFLSSLSGWLCAQFIKTVISLLQGKITDIKDLIASLIWKTGGMPSSHSSLVCALSTSIGFSAGVNSDIFILSMCFTLVVIRDALGVRRASGMQARAINELGEELKSKNIVNFKPIKEVHGHKPLEVAIGCLLGFFTGMAFSVL